MRFFTKFPYTNINNLNLDWIIERLRVIEDFVSSVSDSIEAAQTAADNAQSSVDNKILYFRNLTISPASNEALLRIPASGSDNRLTTDSVVAEFNVQHPENIRGNLAWTSYNGYIQFTGTCSGSTLCNVVIANI